MDFLFEYIFGWLYKKQADQPDFVDFYSFQDTEDMFLVFDDDDGHFDFQDEGNFYEFYDRTY